MPKPQYEIHLGEIPPPRSRPPFGLVALLIQGDQLKFPKRVTISAGSLLKRGFRLKTRTTDEGWFAWAVPITGEVKKTNNPKPRKREKRKA